MKTGWKGGGVWDGVRGKGTTNVGFFLFFFPPSLDCKKADGTPEHVQNTQQ